MNPKFTQEVLDLTKNPNFNFSVDADPINKTAFIAFQNGSMHPLLKDALSTMKPGERVLFYININNFDDDISNDSIYHSNDMYGDCVRIDSDMGSIRDWCNRPSDEFIEFITNTDTTPIRSPFDWSDKDIIEMAGRVFPANPTSLHCEYEAVIKGFKFLRDLNKKST